MMTKAAHTSRSADGAAGNGEGCCEGGGCNNHLATANFFLPAGLSAITRSMRSFRESFRASLEVEGVETEARVDEELEEGRGDIVDVKKATVTDTDSAVIKSNTGGRVCCDDDACNNGHLSTANLFLPAGLSSITRSMRGFRESFRMNESITSADANLAASSAMGLSDAVLPRPTMRRRSSLGQSLRNTTDAVSSTAAKVFDPESSRASVRRLSSAFNVPQSNSAVGRSHLTATGICCSSEIPAIQSILLPLPGVSKVSVSPATKAIYVEHDIDIASADDLCRALNEDGGFGASIVQDAALGILASREGREVGIPKDVTVTSVFDVSLLSKEGERVRDNLTSIFDAPTLNELEDEKVRHLSAEEEAIQLSLESSLSGNRANALTVPVKNSSNVSEGALSISVQYNPYYVTASQIASQITSSLNDNNFHDSKGQNGRKQWSASIQSDGGADGHWALSLMKPVGQQHEAVEFQTTLPSLPVVLSGILWIVSMLSHIGGHWEYLKYVALPSIVLGLYPIATKALRTLRRRKFDVNCMILFAVLGAVALQDFTEAAAVTFLFAISEWLESLTTARARDALSAIVSLRPERANWINPVTKEIIVVPVSAVTVGSLVSVRIGDKVPCDGVVAEGSSAVDESNLTGESRPVRKSSGNKVSGGTINVGNAPLVIRTTATTNDSAVARLIRLVEEAQSNRSDTEALVDSFAQVYTPIVVMISFCMCTFPWLVDAETGRYWLYNGLVVIVIACPCALIISTPITYVAGLAAAAQKGVIIKGGQHLETLGRTKCICLDKTGTLSEGSFQLLHFNVVGHNRMRKEVLAYLSLMEVSASHPLADAIVRGAANEGVDIPRHLQVKDHKLLPGEGITGIIDDKRVYVGNKRLFDRLGLMKDLSIEDTKSADEWTREGGTVGFISIEGEGIVGSYCVSDRIRPEAKDVVQGLKRRGIAIKMLTGDQRSTAMGVAASIGLEECDVESDLLPEEKLSVIRERVEAHSRQRRWWRAKNAVMMVGDGVNDAPALALADVSVAMGEGAVLAMETSDITLMGSDLNKLLYIVGLGPRVLRTIVENVAFSFAVKALVMGFTFAGRASLWAAIASDVGAMLLVTLNGMRLLPSSRKVKASLI